MKAKIYINYKDGILDPEGATIGKALESMGINSIQDLSVGKCKEVNLKCKTKDGVRQVGIEWCIEQSKELKNFNVPFLHYYSMGKSDNIKKIARAIF